PARPRCRGVAPLRYAWTWAGQCRRGGARRSRGRAFRACLGGTRTSSSAVPGGSAPALRLELGRDRDVEPVLDDPTPFIELVLDVPSDDVQSLPGRDEHQLVRGAGV